jgi:hypothetical protein
VNNELLRSVHELLDEADQLRALLNETARQIDRHALFCTTPSSHELRQWAERLDAYFKAEEVLEDCVEDELRPSAVHLH